MTTLEITSIGESALIKSVRLIQSGYIFLPFRLSVNVILKCRMLGRFLLHRKISTLQSMKGSGVFQLFLCSLSSWLISKLDSLQQTKLKFAVVWCQKLHLTFPSDSSPGQTPCAPHSPLMSESKCGSFHRMACSCPDCSVRPDVS